VLTPRPYQVEGIDWLAARRFGLLAFDMRLGKTMIAVKAAEKIGAENVVVVCPAIAVPHWEREFDRWTEGRLAAWVYSYDGLRNNAERILRPGAYDLAIIDECHFAKSPEAKRTKLVYGIGGLGWCADRLWALSGTPAPKHAGELWPMLKAFGVVKMTYDEFINRYCTINRFTLKITGTREAMIPELRELLAKVMLRRTRKQVAPEMPGIDFQFLEVEPAAKDDLPADLDAENLESAPSLQAERIAVAQAKVLPLAKHIDFAIQNELLRQGVVFGWHVEPLEHLARLLNECGIRTEIINGKTSPKQRELIQENFKNGLTQIVAGNIMACGTAIDLSAANHAWMMEMDWVPANNVQAANRLVSMMKDEKVTVDVVTWPGSMDDRVQQVLVRRVRELSQLY
jgi:SNF2 family DNA or RNA helicase